VKELNAGTRWTTSSSAENAGADDLPALRRLSGCNSNPERRSLKRFILRLSTRRVNVESLTLVSSLTIESESPSIAGLTRKRWPRGADLGRAASATHSGKTSLASGEAA
jgi:hypothetical protein